MKVGDLVRLAKKIRRTDRVDQKGKREFEEKQLPEEEQRVGLVVKAINSRTGQMHVLCDRGVKFWFAKQCERL